MGVFLIFCSPPCRTVVRVRHAVSIPGFRVVFVLLAGK
jgi:hypothetical protein